jgi:hypothetical protein
LFTLLLEKGSDVNALNYCSQVDLCDFFFSGLHKFDLSTLLIFVQENQTNVKICHIEMMILTALASNAMLNKML